MHYVYTADVADTAAAKAPPPPPVSAATEYNKKGQLMWSGAKPAEYLHKHVAQLQRVAST